MKTTFTSLFAVGIIVVGIDSVNATPPDSHHTRFFEETFES